MRISTKRRRKKKPRQNKKKNGVLSICLVRALQQAQQAMHPLGEEEKRACKGAMSRDTNTAAGFLFFNSLFSLLVRLCLVFHHIFFNKPQAGSSREMVYLMKF